MGRALLGHTAVGRETTRRGRGVVVPLVVCAVAVALLLGTFVVEPVAVPTGSMSPTLRAGDHVLVNKLAYRFGEPRRRDLVVLRSASGELLLKRVVGVGGDDVGVEDGVLVVNGRAVREPFVDRAARRLGLLRPGPRAPRDGLRDGRPAVELGRLPHLRAGAARPRGGPRRPSDLAAGPGRWGVKRIVATGLLCAGLCAWQGGGVARAQDASATPTVTPAAPLNTEQGEGALPAATPGAEDRTATPSPPAAAPPVPSQGRGAGAARRARRHRAAGPSARRPAHPAVPAADLQGGRRTVRRALGGAGGHQRDRDGLRPQPQRLLGRGDRLDAVHARVLGALRPRCERGWGQRSLRPERRDLRGRSLPAGGGRGSGPARRDLRLQPRRLVRRLGARARARGSPGCRSPRRARPSPRSRGARTSPRPRRDLAGAS